MPCNCGAAAAERRQNRILTAVTRRSVGGAYPLTGVYSDCTATYPADGPHAGDSLYVVGRGSEHQRLFPRRELGSASAYAREVKAQIENLPTTSLCAQAVTDTLS